MGERRRELGTAGHLRRAVVEEPDLARFEAADQNIAPPAANKAIG